MPNLDIEDFPAPNSQDDIFTPVTTRAGQVYDDPTGALPPGTEKYQVTSNQWLALPLDAGTYTVRGREEGQTLYISQSPDSNTALRVTKAFNVDLQNRTVMYVKGQSIFDQIIRNLESLIANKANSADVYTKTETELLIEVTIQDVMAGITNVMQFKGTIPTSADLPTANVENGDVYQAIDTGKFYVAQVENGNISWEELSGTFVDLADYYNKTETELLMAGKADQAVLEAYKTLVENFIPTFTWQQNTDPAVDNSPQPIEVTDKATLDTYDTSTMDIGTIYTTQDDGLYWELIRASYITVPDLPAVDTMTVGQCIRLNSRYYQLQDVNGNDEWVEINTLPKVWKQSEYDPVWQDPTKEWDTWFQPETGLVFVRKVSQLDGSLFWLNSMESALVIAARNYVTTNTQQNITAVKTFTQLPETDTNILPTKDTQFVTKKYVDDNAGTGGGGQIPPDVARLTQVQTFTNQNSFQVAPDITIPTSVNNIGMTALITKSQVQEITTSLFNSNPTIANPLTLDQLNGNQLVTKDILQNIGGVGNVDTTNFAKLNAENTFAEINTFEKQVSLNTDPISGNDAVRMSYMNTRINEEITTNNQNYYTSTVIDNKLQGYVKTDTMADFMEFKGTLRQYAELQAIQNPEIGDTYYVENPDDKKGFWSYDGTNFLSTGTGVTINDQGYAKLGPNNSNIYNSSNTFNLTYRDPADPNAPTINNTFSVGDWLSITPNGLSLNTYYLFNSQRSLFKAPKFELENIANFETTGITLVTNPTITTPNPNLTFNDLVTKQYVDDSLANVTIDETDLAHLSTDNTFEGTNLFQLGQTESFTLLGANTVTVLDANKDNIELSVPLLQTVTQVKANMQDGEYITKKYLDEELANYTPGGGGGGNAFDFDGDHTYTGNNTFNGKLISGTTIGNVDDLTEDGEVVTKKILQNSNTELQGQIDEVKAYRVVSTTEPNGDYPIGTIWIKTSYTQDQTDNSIFPDIPGIYISVGQNSWWDLHKERLL